MPEGIVGIARLHELIAWFAGEDTEPEQVLIGSETDRGRWVAALVAAGYSVFAINPRQLARYRERHATSGAKSDAGDGHVLADMVGTDWHQLRRVGGDTALVEGIKGGGTGAPEPDLGPASRGVAAALGVAGVFPGRPGCLG